MKNILYLHTGSNDGDRLFFLDFARCEIEKTIGIILSASEIYETEAWGKKDQSDFLNQALKVSTELLPADVLKAIKKIEKVSGRKREIKWGSRTLDIDILFYNDRMINTKNLAVPHPRLHKRNFVLIPLSEIAADLRHPVIGLTISELLEQSKDESKVKKCSITS